MQAHIRAETDKEITERRFSPNPVLVFRSYSVNHVPGTNLILLVVVDDAVCQCVNSQPVSGAEAVEIKYILYEAPPACNFRRACAL